MGVRINMYEFNKRLKQAFITTVPVIIPSSILGFLLLLMFYTQYGSGLLLSLLYLPDPAFIIVIREEINAEVW
jgi:hypothetical protein